MKLMTLNSHSLVETDYERKLRQFVDGVLAERPDVIALQEVNQSIDAPEMDAAKLIGYVPAQEIVPIRADNHAANAASLLREAGMNCSWTYLPIKVGYAKYDEGLAILVLNRPIRRTASCLLSRRDDYANWKNRKALAVQVEGLKDWFCTVHMGWWEDQEEPFLDQWRVLNAFAREKSEHARVWLMGDFNSPAGVRDEGYECISSAGWHDTYLLAQTREGGATVPGMIDGWRDRLKDADAGMRIDHIWCSEPVTVSASRVVFDGVRYGVTSDHYGVQIEMDEHLRRTEGGEAEA